MEGYTESVGPLRNTGFFGFDRLRHADVTKAAFFTSQMLHKGEMPFGVALDHFRDQVCAADQPDPGEVEALGILLRGLAYWIRSTMIANSNDWFNSPYSVAVHAVCGFVATGDYEAIEMWAQHSQWGGPDYCGPAAAAAMRAWAANLALNVKAGVEWVYRKRNLNYEGSGQ